MMKMKVSNPKCRVIMRKHLGGSVLKGTVFNRWEGITTRGDTGQGGADARPTNRTSVWTPLLHAVWKPDPKKRDQLRISLTRSYRSPSTGNLIARPSINRDYDPALGENPRTSPDSAGNPRLQPELATGVDIAAERYLEGGGILSANLFHRNISNLIRSQVAQENVSWSPFLRWVRRAQNIGDASTRGLELEAKFRLDHAVAGALPVELRANAALFSSRVKGIPGPDNRLEQQQPWTLNLGADYRMKSLPVSLGVSVNLTPEYEVQQTELQRLTTGQARGIDAFAMWNVSKVDTLRVGVNGVAQPANRSTTAFANGDFSRSVRQGSPWWSVNWEHKF